MRYYATVRGYTYTDADHIDHRGVEVEGDTPAAAKLAALKKFGINAIDPGIGIGRLVSLEPLAEEEKTEPEPLPTPAVTGQGATGTPGPPGYWSPADDDYTSG